MTKRFELPPIAELERTPLVRGLLSMSEALVQEVQRQEERIGQLEDEIAMLKGEKKRPDSSRANWMKKPARKIRRVTTQSRPSARAQKSAPKPRSL